MISSDRKSNKCDTTCRMANLIEKLSIEEQRILARLLFDWEKRDQRRHSRIPCSIITEYRDFNNVCKGTIKNISLGGAYIESSHKIHLNLEINHSFFFPNFEIPLQFKSMVKWKDSNGFGVQFDVIESEN